MNGRVLFFIIVIGIAILLVAISISVFLLLKEEKIFENYDCYVFSIFWTPTTCSTKLSGNYECFQTLKELKIDKYFTLHGLWPSLLSGKMPESCNQGKKIIPNFDKDKKFKNKLELYWPGLYSNNTYFWSNEYNKHGYCYIKRSHYNVKDEYIKYFKKTISMFEDGYRNLMENILPDSKGVYNVSKQKFKKYLKYGKINITDDDISTYSLMCDPGTNLLSEIRFVIDLNFKRTSPKKLQENCTDFFLLNFTDEEKIPVYEKYDFYVFSISYGPNYCREIGKKCIDKLKSKIYNKFVLHGLWPSYKNGVMPQECNIGEDFQIKNESDDYFNNIRQYWYSLSQTDEEFWTHEYNVHGYCYMQRINENIKEYKFYFDKVMEIYDKNNFSNIFDYIYGDFLPRVQTVNKTYLITKLSEIYPNNSFYFSCKKDAYSYYYLDEIRFKIDLDFNFLSQDVEFYDDCPEEFIMNITDRPKKTYEQAIDEWNTYDLYVYSIFFQSTTCKEIGYHCYNAIEELPKNLWTIHGLWPNYKNGSIPIGWCNGKNDIDIEIKNESLYNFMKDYYPGLFNTNEGFWGYEYNKHGYCFNQRYNYDIDDYEKYFLKTVEIYKKYDLGNIFINMYGKGISKGDMKIKRTEIEEYLETKGINNGTYLLICSNITINNINVSYIKEIRIRFDLNYTLYENLTEVNSAECPSEFMAEFI